MPYDSDAQAFFTAAGISDTTQKDAVDALVVSLKAAGVWSKCLAIYPFVGSDATKHSYNLKNPSNYQITWHGTVTHNANGITGDGSTGYGDTGLNVLSDTVANDAHLSIYSRTSGSSGSWIEAGINDGSDSFVIGANSGGAAFFSCYRLPATWVLAAASGDGFYLGSRTSSTSNRLYHDTTTLDTNTTSSVDHRPNLSSWVGAVNGGGFYGLQNPSARNIAFHSIGSGLNDAEAYDYFIAVETYQEALSRGVSSIPARLTALPGSITLTPAAATLTPDYRTLTAGAGSIVITPAACIMDAPAVLNAVSGTILITPAAAILRIGDTFLADHGAIALTPASATLKVATPANITAGQIELTGAMVQMVPREIINVIPPTIALHPAPVYSEINEPDLPPAVIYTIDLLGPRAIPEGLVQVQLGRLTVDDAEIQIRDFEIDEDKLRIDQQVRVTLADVADRDNITEDSVIKFETGTRNALGVMEWNTEFDEGQIGSTVYDIARGEDGAAADVFTFTGISESSKKLATTAEWDIILYDPMKISLDAADFETVTDNFNRVYTTTLVKIPNMKLYDVLDYVVEACDFANKFTDIENYPLSRVEIKAGQTYFDAIAAYIAMFEPYPSVVNDVLWIHDGTVGHDSDSPAAIPVTIDDLSQLGVNTEIQRVDCLDVTYAELRRNFDYSETRELPPSTDHLFSYGVPTADVVTTLTYRDYFRNSQPDKPVVSDLEKKVVKTYIKNFLGQVTNFQAAEETERYYTDSYGREIRHTLVKVMLVLQFGDVTWTFTSHDETDTTTWKAHPLQPSKVYQARREEHIKRHVTLDGSNTYFDRPFQAITEDLHRAGLLTADNVNQNPPKLTDINIEEMKPLTSDTVLVTRKQIDALAGLIKSSTSVQRVGDVGVEALVFRQGRIPVFLDDTTERDPKNHIEEFNIGEVPLTIGIPLAVRVLRSRKTWNKRVLLTVIGIDHTLLPGMPIEAFERDSETSLGIYSIEGRRRSGRLGAYFTQLECKQIG